MTEEITLKGQQPNQTKTQPNKEILTPPSSTKSQDSNSDGESQSFLETRIGPKGILNISEISYFKYNQSKAQWKHRR